MGACLFQEMVARRITLKPLIPYRPTYIKQLFTDSTHFASLAPNPQSPDPPRPILSKNLTFHNFYPSGHLVNAKTDHAQ